MLGMMVDLAFARREMCWYMHVLHVLPEFDVYIRILVHVQPYCSSYLLGHRSWRCSGLIASASTVDCPQAHNACYCRRSDDIRRVAIRAGQSFFPGGK